MHISRNNPGGTLKWNTIGILLTLKLILHLHNHIIIDTKNDATRILCYISHQTAQYTLLTALRAVCFKVQIIYLPRTVLMIGNTYLYYSRARKLSISAQLYADFLWPTKKNWSNRF